MAHRSGVETMTDRRDEQPPVPSPQEQWWATATIATEAAFAPEARARTWSALRNNTLTIIGLTISLSLLALQINEDLRSTWMIKSCWLVLIGGLGFGFTTLIFDYLQTGNRVRWAELANRTRGGAPPDSMSVKEIEEQLSVWIRKIGWQETVTDTCMYLSVACFPCGISLLVAFAWSNL